MTEEQPVVFFWFRRDLRLYDNCGLYHALKSGFKVLPVFIFDRAILDKLEDEDDARVSFIYDTVVELDRELKKIGSSLIIKHAEPHKAWQQLVEEYKTSGVYTNEDYEPYALQRDAAVSNFLASRCISFHKFKDQVIFSPQEVLKDNGKPYTVYSPYQRTWMQSLKPDFHLKAYPTEKYFSSFFLFNSQTPSLEEIGFKKSCLSFPGKNYKDVIGNYAQTRDYPSVGGTSKISIHMRFGTISVREVATEAYRSMEKTWLKELIWREFYMMILWYFPQTVKYSFRPAFDKIDWRNNSEEFDAWCKGETGYPIVDAGMRQLNNTGWMHNRVRMITASFLTKHLLVDWRWGEAYFARKLLDYDQASNVGGWQWAAGSGNDAVPYFRVFNPELQTQKFDPELKYIKTFLPEFSDPFKYPKPIVEHKFARERALRVFKEAL